ncbi:hypothetical protein FQA39_LY10575 [Lamprigera yunnana]|nr:hypothetical protein FQA39_LY10575 [Lamprigera yunnana]
MQPLDLAADLTALEKDINSKKYRLAIPVEQLLKYYKLDIADCTVADQKIYIHIRVPIIQGKTEWKLYELITTPFAWNDETCIIMHDTLYIAVNEKAKVPAVKVISGTALRHCKPYHDKLCYLPKFESDALFGPSCAYEMFIGATVEELSKHCSFKCHTPKAMLISEINIDTFLPRYEVLTDEEIVRVAMCEDDEQDEDNSVEVLASKKVGNSEAVGALNTALKWAEDNEFDSHEVMFLRRLRDRAFEIKYSTRNSVKQKHVIAISTISQYYTMPLIECVISQDTGIIGIHVPLLKDTLKDLTMKRVITPTFAWKEFTCSVNIPSFAVALVERNERWSIVVPKYDPFREDLCLVTEAYNAETPALLCIRQVLVGGSTRQFASVCPVSCRETGRQNQFISFVGSHRAWITHPKPGLRISCQGEHQLNIEPDVYPTYPCVDKTVKFHIQKVLQAVWTKTPGLTLPSWDKMMPQFDYLNDCLNEKWINAISNNQSTPIITYFVIANSIIIILITLTYTYLHCKTQRKFLVDPNQKMNPSDKKSFKFRSLKLPGPTMRFKRAQERLLPGIPNPEENEYLDPNEIHPPRDAPRPPPNSPTSPSRLRPTQTELSAKDEVKTYMNLPQTVRVK